MVLVTWDDSTLDYDPMVFFWKYFSYIILVIKIMLLVEDNIVRGRMSL